MLVLLALLCCTACRSQSQTPSAVRIEHNYLKDTTLTLRVRGHAVDLVFPKQEVRGCLLLLPGWNYDRQKWCRESRICKAALDSGWVLVLPEMALSVYHNQIYPETRPDWRGQPTRAWLRDTVIPLVQDSFGLLKPGGANAVLGLSTGGRGVALMALDLPQVFRAAASLSGDFDQRALPQDPLTIGYYGPLARFPERWALDNPVVNAAKFKVPLYLGHGLADAVVPVAQTRLMADALAKTNPQLEVKLVLAPAGKHDFAYWDGELPTVLAFLGKFMR